MFFHSVFLPLYFLFCGGFIFPCQTLKDDSWRLFLRTFCLFVCLNSTSPCVVIPCLSRLLSLFTRASVLWLLPSCISSSWHLSAGCWLRRGSPTWQSLAKWGHDSFASGFCASAGVSPHSITRFKIVCSAVTVLKLSHLKVDEKN